MKTTGGQLAYRRGLHSASAKPRVARGRAEINRDGTFALTSQSFRILYPRVTSRRSKIRLNKNTAVLNQYILLFDSWLQRVAH